jgi:hypothetical protein
LGGVVYPVGEGVCNPFDGCRVGYTGERVSPSADRDNDGNCVSKRSLVNGATAFVEEAVTVEGMDDGLLSVEDIGPKDGDTVALSFLYFVSELLGLLRLFRCRSRFGVFFRKNFEVSNSDELSLGLSVGSNLVEKLVVISELLAFSDFNTRRLLFRLLSISVLSSLYISSSACSERPKKEALAVVTNATTRRTPAL